MKKIQARIQTWDDEFNKRYNKMMIYVNIGIGVSLTMFFTGIGMIIYGYIQTIKG